MSTVIRPTASLAKKMGLDLSTSGATSRGKLGDWYANDIILNRKQYILCVSEKARLSVLLKAAPYSNWYERLAPALRDLLLKIGVSKKSVEDEITRLGNFQIAKTNSRSVLGSIKDYSDNLHSLDMSSWKDDEVAFEATLWLADIISLILPLGTPKDTVLTLMK